MDFTKEERDDVLRAVSSATTTLSIFAEPDSREDEATQAIRRQLGEYADRLFDLQDEMKKYFENFKSEFE